MDLRAERGTRLALGRPRQWWAVLGVVVALLTVSAALAPFVHVSRFSDDSPAHFMAVLFGLTLVCAMAEVFVLHIQVKREAQTLALSEIPLVLGLTFVTPLQLVGGMVLGAALAFVLHRGQRGLKLTYNLSLKTFDAVVGVMVYRIVLNGDTPLSPSWMVACYAAVATVSLADGVMTHVVIGLHDGSLRLRAILGDIALYPLLALAVSTLTMVGVFAFAASPLSAVPAGASGMALFIGYHAYSKLSERHLSLERLYLFSRAVTSTPEVNETLAEVLSQATELLRSEYAEVTFFSDQQASAMRVGLTPEGELQRTNVVFGAGDPSSPAAVAEHGPLLLARNTREAPHRELLAARAWTEGIVVPLRGDTGVIGTIGVADRMGQVRGFDLSDVRLLETVANHAGVALQNSRLVDQLRHESLHDSLTGLPNRVLMHANTEAELRSCANGTSIGSAIMIMDLDGFKDINDTLGHQHGDELLQTVAARMLQAAGSEVTVARLGGDEFALMVPGCADLDQAHALADAVLAAIAAPTVLEGIAVHVGASIGVALAPLHAADTATLLRYSDVAMYAAKQAGGGVRVYEADSDTSSPERLALVMQLRTALEEGDLSIHVQPQAGLTTHEIASVEVLARWHHPHHGLISPEQFIPLAERSGLMRPLTEHILRLALMQCATWLSQGLELRMAVNLSARSLDDPDLCNLVEGLLLESGVPARLLTLEITESTVMAEPERAIRVLHALRALGVSLSIDDFGVGYSSLSNLNRMPVQELKIDRSFVMDLTDSFDSSVITRSIIDLGRNLALHVVAEGVEDQQSWDRLRDLGCGFAQGYFIAKPMPPEKLYAWLTLWNARWFVPRQGRTSPHVPSARWRPREAGTREAVLSD